ncbi:MAG: nucleoside triphosphate pyrophosphohydrolase [Neomegalonema sp.]|nr:nucleoside triphosphate pyrophosphohydrolase [Neomegalonema sp.]
MRALRDPQSGCPWDVVQDHASIAKYCIEEAYEVVDAIEREDMGDLRDELGDLLLQVVFHARMAEERGQFDFDDVVAGIVTKMIRRHPHVFGDADHADWEAIKAEEKALRRIERGEEEVAAPRVLDDVPAPLPALTRAYKLQKKAARVGFDWPQIDDVLEKLVEEAQELREARQAGEAQERLEEEMGDLLFVAANLSRWMKVDPEAALRRANAKFVRRFAYIEDQLRAQGKEFSDVDLAAMDALWDEAKRLEKAAE